MHYQRRIFKRTPLSRFLERIKVAPERVFDGSPCWEWQGSKDTSGYGRFHTLKNEHYAHRASYRLLVDDDIPADLEIDHACRNRACVSPMHLRLVTRQENLQYRDKAVTHCKYGHEFTPENTNIRKGGYRICKKCRYRRIKEWRARQREALAAPLAASDNARLS